MRATRVIRFVVVDGGTRGSGGRVIIEFRLLGLENDLGPYATLGYLESRKLAEERRPRVT